MGTNIILLSDGTGNSAAKIWRTNVWRFFEALDVSRADHKVFYDDGIGSATFKPLAIMGGIFGYGLKRNVRDLYKFVCRNYWSDDDEIFGLGFSRGAFTIKVVTDLITHQGLIRCESEAELDWKARAAYRTYRNAKFHSTLRVENFIHLLHGLFVRNVYDASLNRPIARIRFIGLWDTVAAYGFPVEEMTRGVSKWIWPLELPDRLLNSKVQRACHALSLDDGRTTFYPILWTEQGETPLQPDRDGLRFTKNERISQVWFAGVHGNVGGGYPDDSLARISLLWMIEESRQCGLQFKHRPDSEPDAVAATKSALDKDGRLYNPRQGFGAYYRYGPRKLADLCHSRVSQNPKDRVDIELPKIHESVFQRITSQAHPYAPVGIPDKYEVVTDDGRILSSNDGACETPAQAKDRALAQEQVWNLIWIKRLIYPMSIAANVYLFLYPLLYSLPTSAEYDTKFRPVSDLVRIVGYFTPDVFRPWINAYARNPGLFLAATAIATMLIGLNRKLNVKILDEMRAIWRGKRPRNNAALYRFVYGLRTNASWRAFVQIVRVELFPTIFAFCFALAFTYCFLMVADRVVLNFADAAGLFCHESKPPLMDESPTLLPFDTRNPCFPAGVKLDEGSHYLITVQISTDWFDGDIKTRNPIEPQGFRNSDVQGWKRIGVSLAFPFGRTLDRWFHLILRIGRFGSDEHPFNPKKDAGSYVAELTASKSGELFLYVNDVVLPLPYYWSRFYNAHKGEAGVVIKRIQ